ncbi:uncharacterized protein V6R79_001114 [Siganus canaliculatus]
MVEAQPTFPAERDVMRHFNQSRLESDDLEADRSRKAERSKSVLAARQIRRVVILAFDCFSQSVTKTSAAFILTSCLQRRSHRKHLKHVDALSHEGPHDLPEGGQTVDQFTVLNTDFGVKPMIFRFLAPTEERLGWQQPPHDSACDDISEKQGAVA